MSLSGSAFGKHRKKIATIYSDYRGEKVVLSTSDTDLARRITEDLRKKGLNTVIKRRKNTWEVIVRT